MSDQGIFEDIIEDETTIKLWAAAALIIIIIWFIQPPTIIAIIAMVFSGFLFAIGILIGIKGG